MNSIARGLRLGATLAATAIIICVFLPTANLAASAATTWSLATAPSPTGGWSSVSFLHNEWIAFNQSGEIATSPNASTWSEQTAPVGLWDAASFGSGHYIALSSANVIPNEMTSSDGVTWTTVTGPPGTPQQSGHPSLNGEWTGVAYGHGLFVAVSSVGTAVTSSDGITWTRRFWRPQDDFTSVTYGDGRFIAVDAGEGDILMSLDGLHWSLIRQPLTGSVPEPAGGLHLSSVTYGNGDFVALGTASGSGYVATSVSGYVWALHQFAPAQAIDAVAFGCGSFVAAGQSAGPANSVIASPLGTVWSTSTVATAALSRWTGVAYGAGHYVAVDVAGDIASSRSDANCAAKVPSPPQQVSGNVHNGEVWTYMHPPISAGSARVEGYRVAITDGVTTKYCRAPVYFEPNCIITGLRNHKVYWVTTQAYNRFGYSAPTDPEFVIPVATWVLATDAPSSSALASDGSSAVQVTGVIANSEGIYPLTTVSVHVGSMLETCHPNPFGECVIVIGDVPSGTVAMYASYSGFGRSYRSATREVSFS